MTSQEQQSTNQKCSMPIKIIENDSKKKLSSSNKYDFDEDNITDDGFCDLMSSSIKSASMTTNNMDYFLASSVDTVINIQPHNNKRTTRQQDNDKSSSSSSPNKSIGIKQQQTQNKNKSKGSKLPSINKNKNSNEKSVLMTKACKVNTTKSLPKINQCSSLSGTTASSSSLTKAIVINSNSSNSSSSSCGSVSHHNNKNKHNNKKKSK